MIVAELALAREVPEDVVPREQLGEVLVAAHDGGWPAGPAAVLDERADEIVGFIQGVGAVHQAERAHEAPALPELALEVLGRRIAVGLVLGIDTGAEGRREALIERHGDVLRVHLLDEVAEKAGKTVERVDRVAVRVGNVIGHRVIGPEHVDAGIDQVLHRRSIAEARNVRW